MAFNESQDDHISSDTPPPFKRRKFYRKRSDVEDEHPASTASVESVPPQGPMTVEELISQGASEALSKNLDDDTPPLSVAEILRQRKAVQRRRGGIEFTNTNPTISKSSNTQSSVASIDKDETPADIKAIINRFAPQTGQVSDVTDKHMFALPSPASPPK